jgi:hypothetical protein
MPVPPAVNLIATCKPLLVNLARHRLGASLQYRADHVPAPYAERGSFARSAFALKYFELVVQNLYPRLKPIRVMGGWRYSIKSKGSRRT